MPGLWQVSIAGALCLAAGVWAQDATVPGEVTAPYPTLTNISIDWEIEGDDNLNGVVEVRYREAGRRKWKQGMPLRRIPAGEWAPRTAPHRRKFSWANRHSGSIFDLRPDTEYEIHLKLTDPDGGSAERTIRVRTRPFPRQAPNARIRRVTRDEFAAAAASAEPGDVLLLEPGNYGTFEMTRDGVPGRPIVIRGARDYGVLFEGISLRGRKYVHIENVTVDGSIDLLGGEWLVVRRCEVNAKYGIVAKRPPGVKNSYIADNTVRFIMPWKAERMGHVTPEGVAANRGEGIQITGPGNVIAYNRVSGFRDCISTMEDAGAHEQISIDIYNNDLSRCLDDAVEADFAMGNVRVMRNRITNAFMGLSSQPGLGGPTYFVRNVMYNIISSPFKLMRGTIGDVILHNTSVKAGDAIRYSLIGEKGSRALLRNNLLIGGEGNYVYGRYGTGPGYVLDIRRVDPTFDLDYNGLGAHGVPFHGRYGDAAFQGLSGLRAVTPYRHVVSVDMSVFANVPFPDPPIPERPAPDLRLVAGSAALDRGVVIPNVNDSFRGAGPDLGAYEEGDPLPHYGPRPQGVDEELLVR